MESKSESTPQKTPPDDFFYIDLGNIDDDIKDSFWWHQIYGDNFGFLKHIPLMHHCRVKNGDVLIHKKLNEGEKFPQINYFLVTIFNKSAMIMSNKDIKSHLIDQLIDYVKKNNKLPFACHVDKFHKNGNVKVDYTPTDWDHFSLDITTKRGERHKIEDTQEFFTGLFEIKGNPAESHKPIQPPIQRR